MPRKVRRRRTAGELTVEQTHDLPAVEAILGPAGVAVADRRESAACFLMARIGDDPAGVAMLEVSVDAGLMRVLFVTESMRRRGAGAALIAALRIAARTRGARMLYALVPPAACGYLARYGFAETSMAEALRELEDISTGPDDGPQCTALRLDISHDGIIER
ncbi:MAG TPA: GNAT family N-acetyltransferase [Candidatus Binataceae bacterium]|nr:GNAT family N-acetyltransferase [Candidatus Binataceae bacterium]